MRRTGIWLVIAAGLLALAPTFSAAQSRLFDGVSLSGRIGPDSPSAEYNFDASRGDAIALRVLGLNGLDPMVTVRGPDGAALLTGFADPWSPVPTDSRVTFSAPDGGPYAVVVQGEGETSGDFVLQFNQESAPPTGLLPGGQAVPVPVSAAAGPIYLQFASKPDCPTTLVISPGGEPDFDAVVNLRDSQGVWFAQLNASAEQRVTVAAGSGPYVAAIVPLAGSSDGQLVLTVTCAAEQPACTAPPVAAEAPPAPTPVGLLMVQPGGDLVTGTALQGEIGQSSPLIGYAFEGNAGQAIALQVTGISFDFQPVVSLIDPTFTQIGSAENTPGEFRPSDAVLHAVLPEDGRFTALIGSADQAPGAFLIRLAEDPASAPVVMTAGTPLAVNADTLAGDDGSLQRYAFTALDSCPTALAIQTTEGFPLATGLIVRRASGELVGQFAESSVTGATLLVPAGSGAYEVLIPRQGDLEGLGELTLNFGCQSDTPACTAGGTILISTPTPGEPPFPTPTSEPGVTPTVTLVGGLSDGVRGVVNVASANVRRGDSQNFSVIRALPQGTEVEVIGVSDAGSGWFKIRMDDGTEGWMAPFVLTVAGNPGDLPRLTPPVAPRPAAPTDAPANVATVPAGSSAVCGNGWCEGDESTSCCTDCGTCGGGGSAPTSPPAGPTSTPVPPTSPPAPFCGDGSCNNGENSCSCQVDCGFIVAFCNNNGTCECGESCGGCPLDCGFCF